MIIATYAVTALLMTLIVGIVAIVCVSLFSSHKYGNTSELADLRAEWEAFRESNSADNPKLKEHHDRLVTLENKNGVMIGGRR